MENQNEEIQLVESVGVEIFEAQERAEIDRQIATAKAYPRDSIKIIERDCKDIVTMNAETAESCRYAKPVAGKQMSGASVHLARIIAQQYGNIRVQQRIKSIDAKSITAEAVAFDLQKNYAVRVEARRSIIGRDGRRFPDHVIETNALATMAIAERNAILKVVPKSLIDSVYQAAFDKVNGNLSTEQEISLARKKAFDYFAEKYNAAEKDVLQVLGLRSVGQVGAEQIANLRAYIQALKDGDITVDDLFGEEKGKADNPLSAKGKKEKEKVEEKKEEPVKVEQTEEPARADGKIKF